MEKQLVDRTNLELPQPFFSLICFLLAECKINELLVTFLGGSERDHMLLHLAEIVASIGVATSSETLSGVMAKQEAE